MTITHRLSKLSFAVVGTLSLVVGSSLLAGCAPSTVSAPTASEPTSSLETTVPETSPSSSPDTSTNTSTESASPRSNDGAENATDADIRAEEADSSDTTAGESAAPDLAGSEATTTEPSSPSVSSPSVSTPPSNAPLSDEERVVAERLASMGIENPQAVKTFLAEMRAAASSQNKAAIADLVRYPFTTYNAGEPLKTYESSAALLEDFHQVVTPTVIEAMSNAQYAELFSNYQGVMIGDGEVWFDQVNQELKIKAINGDS